MEQIAYFLEKSLPEDQIKFFLDQSAKKIDSEGWGRTGRNTAIKIKNFVDCWVTEEAFKQLLIEKKVWFRHRGLYFGDPEGAGPDFTVKINGKEKTLGIRSVGLESLTTWRSVAYPEDRFNNEQDKIAHYHVVCNHCNGKVKFYGLISKDELLQELGYSSKIYSRKNQEFFRRVPLHKFHFTDLVCLIEEMDKVK